MNTECIKQIQTQLAHCFARYGDQPDELIYKLEQLVLEWFIKGEEHAERDTLHKST